MLVSRTVTSVTMLRTMIPSPCWSVVFACLVTGLMPMALLAVGNCFPIRKPNTSLNMFLQRCHSIQEKPKALALKTLKHVCFPSSVKTVLLARTNSPVPSHMHQFYPVSKHDQAGTTCQSRSFCAAECAPGYHAVGTSTTCNTCDRGHYCTGGNATAAACGTGLTSLTTGARSVEQCGKHVGPLGWCAPEQHLYN